MRLNITLALIVASLVAGCSKSSQEEVVLNRTTSDAAQVVTATLSESGMFEHPLNVQEGLAGIHKQATHFSVSSLAKDPRTSLMVYKYVPAKGFTGTDEVMLSTTKKYSSYTGGRDGCNYDSDMGEPSTSTTTFVKIRFTVK